jgi:hypothetical protein
MMLGAPPASTPRPPSRLYASSGQRARGVMGASDIRKGSGWGGGRGACSGRRISGRRGMALMARKMRTREARPPSGAARTSRSWTACPSVRAFSPRSQATTNVSMPTSTSDCLGRARGTRQRASSLPGSAAAAARPFAWPSTAELLLHRPSVRTRGHTWTHSWARRRGTKRCQYRVGVNTRAGREEK